MKHKKYLAKVFKIKKTFAQQSQARILKQKAGTYEPCESGSPLFIIGDYLKKLSGFTRVKPGFVTPLETAFNGLFGESFLSETSSKIDIWARMLARVFITHFVIRFEGKICPSLLLNFLLLPYQTCHFKVSLSNN